MANFGLAREGRRSAEERRECRNGRDGGREAGEGEVAGDEQPECREAPHRAPEPESSVENVLTQIAMSRNRLRCRRYQRSYESLSVTLSMSEPV